MITTEQLDAVIKGNNKPIQSILMNECWDIRGWLEKPIIKKSEECCGEIKNYYLMDTLSDRLENYTCLRLCDYHKNYHTKNSKYTFIELTEKDTFYLKLYTCSI